MSDDKRESRARAIRGLGVTTHPAGTLEALSEGPCTCHQMGPDRIGPWDCPHHGRVDAARERPSDGLRMAAQAHIDAIDYYEHTQGDHAQQAVYDTEVALRAALEAAPVAPGIDVERLARAITVVRNDPDTFPGGLTDLSGDSTAAYLAAAYAEGGEGE
jgi:hypothetical protein